MIRFCAQINEFEIVEMSVEEDHVHILLSAKPRYSPSKIMNLIKGGTSRKLRQLYPDLAENLWGDRFWADGYYVGTVGTRDLSQVREYVRNQQEIHEAPAS